MRFAWDWLLCQEQEKKRNQIKFSAWSSNIQTTFKQNGLFYTTKPRITLTLKTKVLFEWFNRVMIISFHTHTHTHTVHLVCDQVSKAQNQSRNRLRGMRKPLKGAHFYEHLVWSINGVAHFWKINWTLLLELNNHMLVHKSWLPMFYFNLHQLSFWVYASLITSHSFSYLKSSHLFSLILLLHDIRVQLYDLDYHFAFNIRRLLVYLLFPKRFNRS